MINTFLRARSVMALLSLLMLFAPARAGDGWGGFYGGLYAGGAVGNGPMATTVDPVENSYFVPTSVDSIMANGKVSPSAASGLGGITLGFNSAVGGMAGRDLIIGVEGDAGAFDARVSSQKTVIYPCCAPDTYSLAQSIHASGFYTLRGRAGLADENGLFYVTAGLAATSLDLRARLSDSFGADEDSPRGQANSFRAGWVAGAGYEWRFNAQWSIKGEYLHADFGSLSTTAKERFRLFDSNGDYQDYIAAIHHSGAMTADILRVGVNYRL